jgi:hypothetical protein
LKELYDRPWFKRIWCVQEICLARDAVVLWDEQEILWSDVGLAASWIFDKTPSDKDGDPLASLLYEVEAENADLMYDIVPHKASLLEILRSHREWESTDPRDKLYGLLSLVGPQTEAETLKPDYDKSEGDVIADTVLVIIQLYSRLTGLAYVSHPEGYDGEDGYRSWAPHWDDPEVAETIGVSEDQCPWNACAGYNTEFPSRDNINPDQLCLFGVFYDAVVAVEEVMTLLHLDDYREHYQDGIHPFLSAGDNKRRRELLSGMSDKDSGEQWPAFARTLSAGLFNDKYIQNTDEQTEGIFLKAFGDLMNALLDTIGHDAHTPAVLDSTTRQYQSKAYFYCNNRRLFWTENGTFGLGPQCMRTGDVVVVLYGGNTPYVLRPRGNEYLFMGQAYVDNLMQGQLVEEVNAGRLQKQEFCLI